MSEARKSAAHPPRTISEIRRMMDRVDASVWGGADGGFSVVMPDGRSIWVYSDTYTETPMAYGVFIHQTVHSLENSGFKIQNRGGSFLPNESDGTFYWPASGVAVGPNKILMAVSGIQATGSGYFDFIGVSVRACYVTVTDKGDLVFDRWLSYWPTGSGQNETTWNAIYLDGSTLYVFGPKWDVGSPGRKILVAQVPLANVENASSWLFGIDPIRPESDYGAGLSVRKDGNTWRIVTCENFLSADVYLLESQSITGPWSRKTLFQIFADKDMLTYLPMWHPELKLQNGREVVSYSRNSGVPGKSPTVSRPEFVEVIL